MVNMRDGTFCVMSSEQDQIKYGVINLCNYKKSSRKHDVQLCSCSCLQSKSLPPNLNQNKKMQANLNQNKKMHRLMGKSFVSLQLSRMLIRAIGLKIYCSDTFSNFMYACGTPQLSFVAHIDLQASKVAHSLHSQTVSYMKGCFVNLFRAQQYRKGEMYVCKGK